MFLRIYAATRSVEDSVKYSNIAVNIKYMKCVYPQDVMAEYDRLLGLRGP